MPASNQANQLALSWIYSWLYCKVIVLGATVESRYWLVNVLAIVMRIPKPRPSWLSGVNVLHR